MKKCPWQKTILKKFKKIKTLWLKKKPKICFKKEFKITFLALLLLTAGLYFLKNHLIVAIVNGKPIFRSEIIKELEKQLGNEVLNGLITRTLIEQKAQEEKIIITQSEIDEELKKIDEELASRGSNLTDTLKQRNLDKKNLIQDIRLQLILVKLIPPPLITDEEISSYFEKNKMNYEPQINLEDVKEEIEIKLKQEKLISLTQNFIDKLYEKAKIHYWSSQYQNN